MLFNTTILYGGLGLLALQAVAALWTGMLTPAQMKANGRPQGLPFLAHGGMWGDLVVTLLLANVVSRYGTQWSHVSVITALAFGMTLSGVMHWIYTQGDLPEAHVIEHRLTLAGWLHVIFQGAAFAILVLFFLNTENPSKALLWWTVATLTIHLAVANHFVLGFLKPTWYPGRPLSNPIGWATVIGGCAILASVAWWRVGI